jgi:hypothetical protein
MARAGEAKKTPHEAAFSQSSFVDVLGSFESLVSPLSLVVTWPEPVIE